MGCNNAVAHDPSGPSGHLPGFAREECDRITLRVCWFQQSCRDILIADA
jgi:hypothetical protein